MVSAVHAVLCWSGELNQERQAKLELELALEACQRERNRLQRARDELASQILVSSFNRPALTPSYHTRFLPFLFFSIMGVRMRFF